MARQLALWPPRLLATALALPLIAWAWLGWFGRYTSDDYCTAGITLARGFLDAQWYWYTSWSGRFTFTALVSALEAIGDWTPCVLPTLGLAAWVAATSWTVVPIARRLGWPWPRLSAVLVAELIPFATLTAAPNIGQPFFMQTGLVTYTLPLILATLYVGWVHRQVLERRRHWPLPWLVGASAAAAFLVGGLSETTLMLHAAALGLGCLGGALLLRGSERRVLIAVLGAALVGSLLAVVVMGLAPGTAIRVRQEGDPGANLNNVPLAVHDSLSLAIAIVRRFEALDRPTFVLILVAPGVLGYLATRSPSAQQRVGADLRLLVGVLGCGYGLVAVTLFPVFLIQGFDPPDRIQLVSDFVLMVSLVAAGHLLGRLAGQVLGQWIRRLPPVALAPLPLAILAVVPLLQARTILDQTPINAAYAAAWDQDDQVLRAAAQAHAPLAVVEPLPPRWGWDFVGTDVDSFPNNCVARYYGLAGVVASGPAPAWPGEP